MAQYIPGDEGWANAFRNAGAGLVEGYTGRADQMALQKTLEGLDQNANPQDVLKAIMGTKTYDTQAKQGVFENYLKSGVLQNQLNSTAYKKQLDLQKQTIANEKALQDKTEAQALIENSQLPEDKKQQALEQINTGQIGFRGAKEIAKPPKVPKQETDIFDKEAEKASAKRYNEALDDLPKLRDNLANIKQLRGMTKNVEGYQGFIKGWLGTGSASAFDTLAALDTQPILKIFNPAGPIAVAKANLVLGKFAPKSTELMSTIHGKIDTLELIGQQALDRAEKEVELGRKYKGKIPPEEMAKLNAETDVILDVFSQADPTTSNVTGYYSTKDGRALKPMSIQQALDLAKQGLITNVKQQ